MSAHRCLLIPGRTGDLICHMNHLITIVFRPGDDTASKFSMKLARAIDCGLDYSTLAMVQMT